MPKTIDTNKYSYVPKLLKELIEKYVANPQTQKLTLSRLDNILRQDITINDLTSNANRLIDLLPKLYSARSVKNPQQISESTLTDYVSTIISLTNYRDSNGKPILPMKPDQLKILKEYHKKLFEKRLNRA